MTPGAASRGSRRRVSARVVKAVHGREVPSDRQFELELAADLQARFDREELLGALRGSPAVPAISTC